MKAPHLTTHRLARLAKGDTIYYKGQQWQVFGLWSTSLLLESLEVGGRQIIKVWHAEVAAYTAGLEAAHRDFARALAQHKREVLGRRYTSCYFPPAPLEPWELGQSSAKPTSTKSYGL